MAMMARMRSLAPWFMLTVGGVFVLFMVLSDSKVTDYIRGQKQNVGSVDGEEITYQEYSNLVDRARKNQEQSGQAIDESQMDFFRDQVWDALVTQKLMEKKIADFGIVVTDDEIREALMGANPPADIKQQFTDSTGTFNRQMYETAMRDPRNKQILISLEDREKQRLIQQKLQDYVSASFTVSEGEVKDNYLRQNIKMKADYVMIDANSVADADLKVTDDEIKKYYDGHAEDFKQLAERKLKYVIFRRLPSNADSVSVKKNLEAIVTKLKADTASFKTYVQIYSERPYSKDTTAISTLPQQARDILIKANKGQIVGPVESPEGYVVYRVVDKVKAKKELVRASHILIKSTGDDKADLVNATDIYNQLMKGADFAVLAREKSDDGSKTQGGDVGWAGRGQWVKPFEDACFNGKSGVIQKPVKTQFGYHIIKVTDRSNQDLVLEKIINKIQMSGTTQDKIYQDAQDFSYIAKKDGFDAEVKVMKYNSLETPAFTEDAQAIPGLGMNAGLVKFAFDESEGSVSDVFRVNAGYVVATISSVTKPGMKKIDDVKPSIKNSVLREKKLAKSFSIAADIHSKIEGSGDPAIAKTIWPSARVDSTTEFSNNGSIQGIGRDFAFTEYASKGEINKWSQPIKGANGSFLIKVKSRTNFDQQQFASQKTELMKQALQTKKQRYFGQWIQDLKKEAKIVDDRYQFFR
jgi:peptidyl-prolyl cis-trans isomerase D